MRHSGKKEGSASPSDCRIFTPDDEALLETAIEVAKQRMCAAPTRDEKMAEWREMCALIDQRTPSRRRFMARIAGLE